jgi:hypothetical protein
VFSVLVVALLSGEYRHLDLIDGEEIILSILNLWGLYLLIAY